MILIIEAQDDVGLDQSGGGGGNEKCLKFGYILNTELIGVPDELVECEWKRGVKDGFQFFSLRT